MQSPQDKYNTDPHYRTLVDMMESMIHQCQFSPSEMREAAVMASIHHEMRTPRPAIITSQMQEAFDVFQRYRKGS